MISPRQAPAQGHGVACQKYDLQKKKIVPPWTLKMSLQKAALHPVVVIESLDLSLTPVTHDKLRVNISYA